MAAGIEFLFWLLLFALIIICWAITEIVERFKPDDRLPPPAMQCIERGEAWEAGEGRVRFP